ncbi:MAG: phenylalanine--tRNA ligase subunit alpha [Candidatus Omnitrophica bacterium]|nr:phenylalanine--tRNA ligase subunit alpha [Candidatus Omnitrophota bacterium]MCK5287656.1 phenylalanine--tRNA ligase subunit alpha [Candidatus Omnitrophota bacterium]
MENKVKILEETFSQDLSLVKTQAEVEFLRVKYLGRKSELTELFSNIPVLSKEEKGIWGKNLNTLKQKISSLLEDKLKNMGCKEDEVDLTFPSASFEKGSRHILTTVTQEICLCFEKLGFNIIEGNEIEDEGHNFEALNIPIDHPSRDADDTFYLDLPKGNEGKFLLRSHTSPSQTRVMKREKPPLAVISPGRVYRPDDVDATHSFMFHQIEGFAVDETISFAHLKGVLLHFARDFFSSDVELRFRPHYFPFTEPSAEVDVSCFICKGPKKKKKIHKCAICKDKGWLEVLGCGMIHPNVLEACEIDSKKYKGFAFGMGVERIAMLKYGINDIRYFYENDVRFLDQFSV